MAHSRSALKRWRQSIAARDRNRATKSRTRTLLTKAIISVGDDAEASEDAVRAAVSALDKAAQKGVIHPNAAARGKSRLLKRYNLGIAGAVAKAASAAATPAGAPAEPAAPEAPARRRGIIPRRASTQPNTTAKAPPAKKPASKPASGTTRAPRTRKT